MDNSLSGAMAVRPLPICHSSPVAGTLEKSRLVDALEGVISIPATPPQDRGARGGAAQDIATETLE